MDFEFLDMQPGDVTETFANIDHAKNKLNYNPKISIKEGIQNLFVGTNHITNYNKGILPSLKL